MEIRRLGPADWATYRTVRLRALEADPEVFGATLVEESALTDDDWRSRAGSSDWAVFMAFGGGDAVGLAIGGPVPFDDPTLAGLYGMWVAPEARGRGVGGRLVEAVSGWALETGHRAVGLGVTLDNTSAIALYEQHGFADTGERWPLREGSDVTIAIMLRALRSDDAGPTVTPTLPG